LCVNALNERIIMSSHIFIGFGGSGCKTLAQLCSLLSDDAKLCPLADTRYFFLFVDTDLDDVKSHRDKAHSALMRGSVNPYCEVISLSEDTERFSQMVQRFFCPGVARGKEYQPAAEIQPHWWHDANGDPFQAPNLADSLAHGAGQCPPVSYFLAWKGVERLDNAMKDCVEQMQARLQGTSRQDIKATLHLVAGLSGGTGRGCWHLLSLKAREILRKAGIDSQAMGYFYDQSVMSDVIKGNATRRAQMMANSLSGVSELIMWLRNDEMGKKKKNYIVPSVSVPGDDERSVTNMTRIATEKSARGWSPIDFGWIIGGESRAVPTLGAPEAYFEMVGGVLYSRLLQKQIKGAAINDPSNLGSVAAAMCVVPTVDIANWLISEARYRLANRLLGVGERTGGSYLPSAIRSLADIRVDALVSDDQSEASRHFTHFRELAAKKIDLLRRVDGFEKQMKDQNSLKAETQKKEIAAETQVMPLAMPKLFREHMQASYFDKLEFGALLSKRMREAGALRTAHASLSATADDCLAVADALLAKAMELKTDRAKYAADFHITFEQDKQRTSLFSKEYFTTAERDRLRSKASRVLEHDAAMMACSNLAEVLQKLAETALALAASSGATAASLAQALDSETSGMSRGDHDRIGSRIFTKDERDLDDSFNRESFLKVRVAKRILRPVWDASKAESIVSRILEYAEKRRPFHEESEQLKALVWGRATTVGASAEKSEVAQRQMREHLRKMQEMLSAPIEVMGHEFSFAKVLEALVPFWVDSMNKVSGHRRKQLTLSFERLFGFPCPMEQGEFVEPDTVVVLEHLAADLAACCDPFMKFRDETEQNKRDGDEVIVFLPACAGWDNGVAQQIKDSSAFKSHKLKVAAQVIACPNDEGTPFALVAYAHETIHFGDENPHQPDHRHIDSAVTLGYWKDPTIKQRLEDMEDPLGQSFFHPPSDSYGFGYLAPFMVKDEHWSGLRWKPWAVAGDKKRKEAETANQARHFEGMAWLMAGLGKAADDENELVQLVIDIVAKEHKWSLLNLEKRDGSGVELTRELFKLVPGNRYKPADATVGPTTRGFEDLPSIRLLEVALKANPHAVRAILNERELFFQIAEAACAKNDLERLDFRAAIYARIHGVVIEERARIKKLKGASAKPLLECVEKLEIAAESLANSVT